MNRVERFVHAVVGTLFAHSILVAVVLLLFYVVPNTVSVVSSPAFGDFVIANVARAHFDPEPQEFDPQYTRSQKFMYWDTVTNSGWLGNVIYKTVPLFVYEGITEVGVYPKSAVAMPMTGEDSLHLLGQAMPAFSVMRINERMIEEGVRYDERVALYVTIHELIHLQSAKPGVVNWGKSEVIEPSTQAATVEVLAAMCNLDDDTACEAFWMLIYRTTTASLENYVTDTGWELPYKLWERLIWMTPGQRKTSDKFLRHWQEDADAWEERGVLVEKYGAAPWRLHVVPGVRDNIPLLTGPNMYYDDTSVMFGNWLWFVVRR